MLGARLVARWPDYYARYVGTGQQVDTRRGAAVSLAWLREVAPGSDIARASPDEVRDHDRYGDLMRAIEAQGGGIDVSLAALLPRALAAPEYRLSDYPLWLEGANRGSGPMWPKYLSRDLTRDVREMPVPMTLISGARDMNTPVALAREW